MFRPKRGRLGCLASSEPTKLTGVRGIRNVLLAWLIALVSCVDSAPPRGGDKPVGPPAGSPDPAAAVLSPTVEFFAARRTAAENANLVEDSVATCMVERGWEYEPVILDVGGEPLTVGEQATFVGEFGYAHYSFPLESGRGRAAAHANYDYWLALTESQKREYSTDLGDENADGDAGVPPEGREAPPGSCRAMAQEESSLPLYNEPLMDRMREMYLASRDSVELAAALVAYTGCMRVRGYDVATPIDADQLAFNRGAGLPVAEAVEQEIAIASADFECRLSTLLPVGQAIEAQIVETLIEEFPETAP